MSILQKNEYSERQVPSVFKSTIDIINQTPYYLHSCPENQYIIIFSSEAAKFNL